MSAALLQDLRSGYFDKLRTTPASPWAVIFARMGTDMLRVILQGLAVLGLAVALGAPLATGAAGAVVMVVLAALFSACTVGLFVSALALKTKSDQATQSFFPVLFLALFLTSAYMPISLLPETLRTIATYNPLEFLVRVMRSLMLDASWPLADIGLLVGASLLVAVALGALNVRAYRKMAA